MSCPEIFDCSKRIFKFLNFQNYGQRDLNKKSKSQLNTTTGSKVYKVQVLDSKWKIFFKFVAFSEYPNFTILQFLIDIYLIIIFLLSGKGKASNFHSIMGRNRRSYQGSGIPGGVKSFEPRQRGGPIKGPPNRGPPDREPPKPRSSSDRRSPSPPRPHRRLRLPGKWFGFFAIQIQKHAGKVKKHFCFSR